MIIGEVGTIKRLVDKHDITISCYASPSVAYLLHSNIWMSNRPGVNDPAFWPDASPKPRKGWFTRTWEFLT